MFSPGSKTKDNNRKEFETPLLFNLDKDPGEHFNHAAENPQVIENLKTLTLEHQRSVKPSVSELDKY